ncbi:uncharacterized protein LACBIDRAFT_298766 [Laccaria bicolor S238N-H82]|uniref:Predicted protein n=1 Tax=Laccaria bicolor (strain S238N-H82 / ATCC MYA-4686) TaxID=486041 RepID=B0DDJ6_LACBS|nr:uncharacterized protein LACBIDRAFT_298766 [Laccaria bicolor S238N-H82]EDR07486.1 predicted protein [Laccaria bicolor S238N-H82]|eukprot:XP_001881878.1 predicted protein [Laccaria bicolor S238N-H82]
MLPFVFVLQDLPFKLNSIEQGGQVMRLCSFSLRHPLALPLSRVDLDRSPPSRIESSLLPISLRSSWSSNHCCHAHTQLHLHFVPSNPSARIVYVLSALYSSGHACPRLGVAIVAVVAPPFRTLGFACQNYRQGVGDWW